MELGLKDKVALITGGSRGIGRAIAERLVGEGARVMISSRRAEGLREAAASIDGEVEWFVANAGDPVAAQACVEATLERFGALDVLVNNAGTSPHFGPLMEIDAGRAAKSVQVNQQGALVWTQLAWHHAMAEHGGSVLNVASIGGMSVEPGIGWYNVTKAAVIHLTRQLAMELAPKVRVNAVAPGLVKTDLSRALWEHGEVAISARLPLGRLGEPDDVARAGVFLVSEAASWITGETLVIDGGALVLPSGGLRA